MDKNLGDFLKHANDFPDLLHALNAQMEACEKRMAELKELGLIYASGYMRQNRYFMLVYPQKDGVRPPPKYLGTDKAKITQAQAGMARAIEYDRLAALVAGQRETINRARYEFDTARRTVLYEIQKGQREIAAR